MPVGPEDEISALSRRPIERRLRIAQGLLGRPIADDIEDLCQAPVWTVKEIPELVHNIEVELCISYGLDPDNPGRRRSRPLQGMDRSVVSESILEKAPKNTPGNTPSPEIGQV
jgi:hypothetical protein